MVRLEQDDTCTVPLICHFMFLSLRPPFKLHRLSIAFNNVLVIPVMSQPLCGACTTTSTMRPFAVSRGMSLLGSSYVNVLCLT